MSRRSRKRNPAGGRGWIGKILLIVAIVSALGLGVGYAMLRRYLHSDSFRKFLSAEASEVAGVNGEFALFHWDGLAVNTASFEAKGEGMITGLRADELHTEVGFGGVRRGVWEIRGSSLERLEVSVDATKTSDEMAAFSTREKPKKPARPSWIPSEAELQGLDVRDAAVKVILPEGLAVASGMNVHLEMAGAKNAYRMQVRGGTIHAPFKLLPDIRLDKLQLRYQDKQVFLTSAQLGAWKNGRIEASGEWDMKTQQYALEGGASGMTCQDVFSEDWSKRVTDDVASTFTVENRLGAPTANGKLTIQSGVVTALPMLDALAAYSDTRRFRVLNLNEAHADWRWKAGELDLTNLVLFSEGLVRLEGSIIIRGRALDGVFRLGLAPGTLASIPGAETDVFTQGEHGLLWAPLRVTGTLDDPKEDLTDRLIAAAGMRMFDQIPETGEKVIKFTQSVVGDNPNKVVDKGVKIIGKGVGIVREVSGVLDGFLGTEPVPTELPLEDKK